MASKIRLQSSKLNRLPVMSPISEERTQSVSPRTPEYHPTPNQTNEKSVSSPPDELQDLIEQYLSGAPLQDGSLSRTCPCCKEVNAESHAKRKEQESLGTFLPLSLDADRPQSAATSTHEKELKSDTYVIPALTLYRSDTTDLVEQQQKEGNNGSNINDYTLNPHKGRFIHKDYKFPLQRPTLVKRGRHGKSRSNLESDIEKANSLFYKNLDKLNNTVHKL